MLNRAIPCSLISNHQPWQTRAPSSALAHHSTDLLGDLSFVGHLADGKQLEVQAVVEGHISRRAGAAGKSNFWRIFRMKTGKNQQQTNKTTSRSGFQTPKWKDQVQLR